MDETTKTGAPSRGTDPESRARREFLKKVGQASVTAPAVALLLAANVRSASATTVQYGGNGTPGSCSACGGSGSGSGCDIPLT